MTTPNRTTDRTTDRTDPALRLARSAQPTRGSRVLAVLIALACVVVVGVAVKATDALSSANIVRRGVVGEALPYNGARVTVTKVRVGTAIDNGDYADQTTTKGMFVVVSLRVESPNRTVSVGGLSGMDLLADDDYSYSSFGYNSSLRVDPGYIGTGDVAFEVDPRHVAGAHIELTDHEIFRVLPAVVWIYLGITEQNAAQWYAGAKGRVLTLQESEQRAIP